MNDLRTAAQQALEALEWLKQRGLFGDFHGVADTLRAALAEPVQEAEWEVRADGKRVSKDRWQIGIRRIVALLWGNRREFEIDEVIEAVRGLVPNPHAEGDDEARVSAALAEPVQPMAWMNTEDGFCTLDSPVEGLDVMSQWAPLYATPPQRKPLSAADALRIATEAIGRLQSVGPVQGLVGLVRAVEAAHDIK